LLADSAPLFYLIYIYGLTSKYRRATDGLSPFALLWAEPPSRGHKGLLRAAIKDAGYGYVPGRNVWVRQAGEAWAQEVAFVPGISREAAMTIGAAHGQPEVVWGADSQWWRINATTGESAGPFEIAGRLRPLVLDDLLERDVEEIERSGPQTRLKVGPGRQGFFFFREGAGYVTCHLAPAGVAVRDVVPGEQLRGDFNPTAMEMRHIDAYWPL
jgi:hypothetical protein